MDTNIKYLIDNNIHIWNKDAYNYYIKEARSSHTTLSFDNFIDYIKKGGSYVEDKLPYSNHEYILGDLGRIYGAQWRNWRGSSEVTEGPQFNTVDQISNLIKGLKENPMGTRHIVTAWNPAELNDMALPPCHWSFEILVEPLSLEQRLDISGPIDYKDEEDFDFKLNKKSPKYQFTLKWHQRSVDTFLGR